MTTTDVYEPWLDKVVMEVLGTDEVKHAPCGCIPIAIKHAVVNLELQDGPAGRPLVCITASLLKVPDVTAELYEKLNVINFAGPYLRFYWHDGEICMRYDAVAESFRAEDLRTALDSIDIAAEHLADFLGVPGAEFVHAARPDASGDPEPTVIADGSGPSTEKGLGGATGPTAHVSVPSPVLPDDASPAGDASTNITLGYL